MNNEQLIKRINDLESKVNALEANSTIPFLVDKAFRKRFEIDSLSKLESQTAKSAGSESRVVAVGDDVANPMDGFFLFRKEGVAYYIPYYLI